MPTQGAADEPILVFLLILHAYGLKDEGDITRVEDVPLNHVHEVYNDIMVQPDEIFNLKTFNRKLLKSEYKILFNFVQKVFMAFARTHELVTLPKFKVFTAVVWGLSMNWARVLLSMLYEEYS